MKKSTIGWSSANLHFSSPQSIAGKMLWRQCSIITVLLFLSTVALSQQIKFEQGQNGGVGRPPVSPINWAAGNSNNGNSHYIEGQSIPYRVSITNVAPGSHSLIIEWDFRKDAKTAIDFVTDYQRISETVNPLQGLSGNYGQPSYFIVPPPQRNRSVTGIDGAQLQPLYSFSQIPNDKRRITIYNGVPAGISYSPEGDPAASTSSTRLKLDFTVTGSSSKNVVIAWGGHISSRLDWGAPNAASDINGSPYHTRLVSFDGKAGNQDRSLQNAAVAFVPSCNIIGNKTFCEDIIYSYSATTNAPTPQYEWTVTGGTLASGQGTPTIKVTWDAENEGMVSVKIFDQSSSIPSVPTTCSINLTKGCYMPLLYTTTKWKSKYLDRLRVNLA